MLEKGKLELPEPYLRLVDQNQSLILSTIDPNGVTQASYTPFISNSPVDFYILISDLASHTRYIKTCSLLGVLLIEDESSSNEIFARRRASLSCEVARVERASKGFNEILDAFENQHGKTVTLLRNLSDFHLFHLRVKKIRLVTGFGKAQTLELSGTENSSFEIRK